MMERRIVCICIFWILSSTLVFASSLPSEAENKDNIDNAYNKDVEGLENAKFIYPSIQILEPTPVTIWKGGDKAFVFWRSIEVTKHSKINIELLDHGIVRFRDTVPNTGNYTLVVPLNLTPDQEYRIRCTLVNTTITSTTGSFYVGDTITYDDPTISASFSHEAYQNPYRGQEYILDYQTWRTLVAYTNSSKGFAIAESQESKTGIIFFKGTNFRSIADIINDFDTTKLPCSDFIYKCGNGSIHAGFAKDYDLPTAAFIHDAFTKWMKDGYKKVIVTGHSKGAALTLIAALDLFNRFPKYKDLIEVKNFGCPRLGDQDFKNEYEPKLGNQTIRYVNFADDGDQDIVTCIPPEFMGFHHVGKQVDLKPKDQTRKIVIRDAPTKEAAMIGGVSIDAHHMPLYARKIILFGQGR